MAMQHQRDRDDGCGDSSGILSRVALNDNKAGMKGFDREKINRIIHENSVGSKFYENERKKDAQVDIKIEQLRERANKLTSKELDIALGETNVIIENMERNRDFSRTIVHIDMDAFYAAVEERDNPDLKNKPMAVGDMGMLSTSNYTARRYGVRAAMPGFIAKKLCPDLILVPMHFAKYREVSHQVQEILASYDPNFEPIGLDEAYMDLTTYLEKTKTESTTTPKTPCDDEYITDENVQAYDIWKIVLEIRQKIEKETLLTASAGIAPNTLLAKIASDINKPNGQFLLKPTRESVMEFTRKLPIRKVSGIGKVTEKLLNAFDIKTCQDLYSQRAIIYSLFSQTMSHYCLRICLGIGPARIGNNSERKSISTERTFRDISNPKEMYKICKDLCQCLEQDAKKASVKGTTVTLKIKTATFELHTRSKSLFHPVSSQNEVYPVVADLLKQELFANGQNMTLRLIGVGLSKLTKLVSGSQQKSLDYFLSSMKRKSVENGTILDFQSEKADIDVHQSKSVEVGLRKDKDCIAKTGNLGENRCAESLENGPRTSDMVHSSNIISLMQVNSPDKGASSPYYESNDKASNLGQKVPSSSCVEVGHTDHNSDKTCFTCPICNVPFPSKNVSLQFFNTHVDSCLSRRTIADLLKSEAKSYQTDAPFSKTPIEPPQKRRKTSSARCTIEDFFKK